MDIEEIINKRKELEKRQKELADERGKWIEDKNENVSNKLSEKIKRGKEDFITSYLEVSKKQTEASSSRFSKRSFKDENKEFGKRKKRVRNLMGEARLDGRTKRLPKDEQFEKIEKNIDESVNIDQEIMRINKNQTWFGWIFDRETEQEKTV